MERAFETPQIPTVEVKLPAGRVEISSVDGDTTVVRLTPLRDNSASRKAVEQARVELRSGASGPLVYVDVREQHSLLPFNIGMEVEVVIEAPTGTHVKAGLASAGLVAGGTLGSLDVRTASGDVEAGHVLDRAVVRSASGDVRIDRIDGDFTSHTASGDVEVGLVEGTATVRSASGDVTVGAAGSGVTVNSASGDARIGSVLKGKVSLQSASGDLEVGIARGAGAYVDAKSMSGDVSSELDVDEAGGGGTTVDLRATSMSGDISIRRAEGPGPQTASAGPAGYRLA